jgi:signal transduction histidine kinase
MSETAAPLHALVLAPRGRDAALAARSLAGPGLAVEPVTSGVALADALDGDGADGVGVVLLTEEALGGAAGPVRRALGGHPPWSEVPVLLFVDGAGGAADAVRAAGALGPRANVTVLERPLRRAVLVTAVQAALRARRTQLEVRDLLRQLEALNAGLQDRVEQQTVALRERAAEVEALARDLTRAERRERERIAQLLHDDLQQLLYGLKLQLDRLAQGALDPTGPFLDRLAGYADEAVEQTRLLTTDLHPPTLPDDGIGAALGWVADFARRRHGMTVHLDVIEGAAPPDPDALALLAQAAKEMLFNVVKHAGTAEAWVTAACDAEGCRVAVRDEGRGFSGDADGGTGRGLAGLRDRAALLGGWVEVDSAPGRGSRVVVVLPEA